jgi:hypothetical protein
MLALFSFGDVMAQYDRTADYVDITDQFIETLARYGE